MKEIIEKVFEGKIKDGTVEKIVSEQVDKMITSICTEQMGYGGELKKKMAEKLAPIMLEALENSDLGVLTLKITELINANLKGSPLDYYAKTLDLKELFGSNRAIKKLEGRKTIKMSEIFDEYLNYVQDTYDDGDFEREEINYDDGTKTVYVECNMAVNESEKLYWERRPGYEVELSNEKSSDQKSTDVRFKLQWNYDNTALHVRTNFYDMPLSDLRYCPAFFLYLFYLEQNCIKIELDKEQDSTDACIELEWNVD